MVKELSIFADERGDQGGKARYYLLTLVMHDQSDDISEELARYAESLRLAGFPNVPFPSKPLLNGHRGYQRHKVKNPAALSARMKRHISNFMFDHLAYFQSFDDANVYYDDGRNVLSRAFPGL